FVGNRTKVKVVKNKVAPPFKEAEFDIIYGEGISKAGCILDLAVEKDIINKSGAWYSYGETRLGQGRDNAVDFLKKNPELLAQVEKVIYEQYGLNRPGIKEEAPKEEAKAGQVKAGKK
ncbi:MAG: DNA recombination/repair protein RecA, partial [Firmicutes bacterium]|nr:DNA recombination/repair protein RecA [Bacillota bacterium]